MHMVRNWSAIVFATCGLLMLGQGVLAAPPGVKPAPGERALIHLAETGDKARDRWLALARTCLAGKFPNCPEGCIRSEKQQACVPPKPPGSMVKSIPEYSDLCEGYYPLCPETFCRMNEMLKRCEPLLP